MRTCFLILALSIKSISIFSQNHSFGFYVYGIHDFNYLDNTFDREETMNLPILPIFSLGAEYIYTINSKFGIHSAIGLVQNGIKITRRYQPVENGEIVNYFNGKSSVGQNFALKLGISQNAKTVRINSGLQFRYISKNSFTSLGSITTFDNESYQPISNFKYTLGSKLHSSIYINANMKLFRMKKNELRLNFVGNLGLHSISQTTSKIEYFITNETKNIVHNNFGTYLGIGLKFTRTL